MNRSWVIRRYKEGDEFGIARLSKLEYGFDEDYWRTLWVWECRKNPNGHFTMVAEHNGQIVGHMSLVLYHMKVGNDIVTGSQAVDLIVHPSFRGRGIFLTLGKKLLNEAGEKGIVVSYGFPNKPAHSGHLKYGWFDVCNVPNFTKFLDTYIALNHYLAGYKPISLLNRSKVSKSLLEIVLRVTSLFINLFVSLLAKGESVSYLKECSIKRVTRFDRRFDDFWKNVSENYRIAVVREHEYLNWRYFSKPNTQYMVFVAEGKSKILGYIILQVKKKAGYIIDIFAYPDGRVIASLLSETLRYFKRERVGWVTCLTTGSILLYRVLRERGFIPIPSECPLIARINSPQIPEKLIRDTSNWYITMGDSIDRGT